MELTVPIRGEWVSLASALTWSVSTMIYRMYGGLLRPTWITLYKGVISIFLLAATVMSMGGFSVISWQDYTLLALSGVIGISLGDTAFFGALPKIGAGLTSAIQCIAPPLTAMGAVLVLGEHLTFAKSSGLLVTTVSVAALILFEKPISSDDVVLHKRTFRIGLGLAILAAVCQSAGVLLSRKPLSGLSPAEGSVHRMLVATLLIFIWEWRGAGSSLRRMGGDFVAVSHKFRLALAAVLGTYLGLVFMIYGMTHAPVGIALAINSSYPIWVTMLEFAVFKTTIQKRSIICLFLAIGGLFIMLQ